MTQEGIEQVPRCRQCGSQEAPEILEAYNGYCSFECQADYEDMYPDE
jgi:hypothetical protein